MLLTDRFKWSVIKVRLFFRAVPSALSSFRRLPRVARCSAILHNASPWATQHSTLGCQRAVLAGLRTGQTMACVY